uniref:Uncharacterized protein n=1 Tax=Tetradesmus obliquus TaxID=3088 RepID=A0A383VXE8_TETOB|eukprot:jgi/Sobl393_1/8543/SZX69502.1
MASKAATLGDPRRPAEIKKYVRSAEEGPHPLGLISLTLGVGSMAVKMKAVGWVALLVSLAAIVHIPGSHPDFKQALSSSMISLVSLGAAYFMPVPVRPGPAAAAAAPPPAATG